MFENVVLLHTKTGRTKNIPKRAGPLSEFISFFPNRQGWIFPTSKRQGFYQNSMFLLGKISLVFRRKRSNISSFFEKIEGWTKIKFRNYHNKIDELFCQIFIEYSTFFCNILKTSTQIDWKTFFSNRTNILFSSIC